MQREKQLYFVEQLPIFQNRMYESPTEAKECPRGNVRLVQNLETGLIYNADFRPELMTYDASYQNEQAHSQRFQNHLFDVMAIIEKNIGREGLVEIGCGKGYFLKMACDHGLEVTGFDPTYEGKDPRIVKRYFEPGVNLTAKGLILRHVLEHVPSPVSFLQNLLTANNNTGLIYIEVPCFDWICEHRAWFDIYYEHVNYFRMADFGRMFSEIIECGRLFGGQYLYVVADLQSLRLPRLDTPDEITLPEDFLNSLRDDAQGPSAVWGGASKGVIFTLLRSRLGYPIDTVIDINPAKQGKYLPGTGLKVHSPSEALVKLPPGSTIYVMNSIYLDEIKLITNHSFRYVCVDHDRI